MLEDCGCDTGHQVEKRLVIAVGRERQFHHGLRFDLGADISAIGLENRRRRGDNDGLRDVAGLERNIDAGRCVGKQVDVLLLSLFESGCVDGDDVDSGLHVGKRVVSARIGCGLVNCAGGCECGCHLGIRNGCVGGISDRSEQRAIYGLAQQHLGKPKHKQGEYGPDYRSHHFA